MRFLSVFLFFVVGFSPVFAADPPELVTDRPDQTESTATIPKGWVQTEFGLADAKASDAAAMTLVRIGLSERVELRVGIDEWFLAGPEDAVDVSLGAKVALVEERGKRPAMAVIATLNQIVGDSLSPLSDGTRPSFRFAFSNTLTDRLSLGYNAGVAWDESVGFAGMPPVLDKDLTSHFVWTAALGIAGGERLGFFVEAYGDTGLSAGGPPETAIDGGMTWLVRPNVQIDFFAGAGVSDVAPDWTAGVGVSFRVPN